jgi:hypothetical protein
MRGIGSGTLGLVKAAHNPALTGEFSAGDCLVDSAGFGVVIAAQDLPAGDGEDAGAAGPPEPFSGFKVTPPFLTAAGFEADGHVDETEIGGDNALFNGAELFDHAMLYDFTIQLDENPTGRTAVDTDHTHGSTLSVGMLSFSLGGAGKAKLCCAPGIIPFLSDAFWMQGTLRQIWQGAGSSWLIELGRSFFLFQATDVLEELVGQHGGSGQGAQALAMSRQAFFFDGDRAIGGVGESDDYFHGQGPFDFWHSRQADRSRHDGSGTGDKFFGR